MADDARSDWLEIVKSQAQGIRSSVLASVLFVVVIAITLLGQYRQLTADERAQKSTACFSPNRPQDPKQPKDQNETNAACPLPADWETLQGAYEELPVEAIDAELIPWNKFGLEITLVATFVEGTDPKTIAGSKDPSAPFILALIEASQETPLKPGTAKAISHFYLHLKDFNSNFKSIEWASNAKIPFEDLNRDKLIALANAYNFDLDQGDLQGQNVAKTVANPTFMLRLSQLQLASIKATGNPLVEDSFVATLSQGTSLASFKTLRGELMVNDLAKFQNRFPKSEADKLLAFLQATPFASVGAVRNEDARLRKQIQDIRDEKTDSSITIPLLNLPVTLSDFSSLSGILNVLLLLWVFWQVRQMNFALVRYRSFEPYDKSRIEAALSLLPSYGRWHVPVSLAIAACLTVPTLLGTCILFMPRWTDKTQPGHPSYLYLVLPLFVLTLSLVLVRSLQNIKARALTVPSNSLVEPTRTNGEHS
jgi:hypothetical protein